MNIYIYIYVNMYVYTYIYIYTMIWKYIYLDFLNLNKPSASCWKYTVNPWKFVCINTSKARRGHWKVPPHNGSHNANSGDRVRKSLQNPIHSNGWSCWIILSYIGWLCFPEPPILMLCWCFSELVRAGERQCQWQLTIHPCKVIDVWTHKTYMTPLTQWLTRNDRYQ